jgi:transposase
VSHISPQGSEDETQTPRYRSVVRRGRQGHPPGDAQALLRGREDPHRTGGLRGEHSIAELCRREGIAEGLYYSWSKEFLEAGKRRLAGDTARAATSDEVKAPRRELGI